VSRPEIDRATLRRAQEGDPQAFRLLYECYAAGLEAFLARLLPEGAEDALQDTFLRVHHALPRFTPDGPAALSTWIYAIGRRVALSRLESRRREPTGAAAPPTGCTDDPDLRQTLARAIAELPASQRTVFVLRECCHLAYDEIAVIEQVDLGTVKSRLHRARIALQDRLAEVLGTAYVPQRRGGQR
jgi:RNA polymerase sigma-70 factor (ECF subfamily)